MYRVRSEEGGVGGADTPAVSLGPNRLLDSANPPSYKQAFPQTVELRTRRLLLKPPRPSHSVCCGDAAGSKYLEAICCSHFPFHFGAEAQS